MKRDVENIDAIPEYCVRYLTDRRVREETF